MREVLVGNDPIVLRSHSETKIKESKTETIEIEQSTPTNFNDTDANETNSLSIQRNLVLFETNSEQNGDFPRPNSPSLSISFNPPQLVIYQGRTFIYGTSLIRALLYYTIF